jgi:hypothetical protein
LMNQEWIMKITKTEEAYITIGINGMNHHIWILIKPEIMEKLVRLNIVLDCDIYSAW